MGLIVSCLACLFSESDIAIITRAIRIRSQVAPRDIPPPGLDIPQCGHDFAELLIWAPHSLQDFMAIRWGIHAFFHMLNAILDQ
jgi:hypothetical protein